MLPEIAQTSTLELPRRVISTRLQRRFFRNVKERVIEGVLLLAGLLAVATTIAIVCILVYESLGWLATAVFVASYLCTRAAFRNGPAIPIL